MIETKRLLLKPASPLLVQEVLDYYLRNRDFLRPFEPERAPEFYTPEHQTDSLRQQGEAAQKGESFCYYLSLREQPEQVLGSIALNNIVRGCFQSCFLGYRLDEKNQRKGYMTEAVAAVTDYAFRELGLHRIEGNVMPRNQASLRVLEKAGYREEGLASLMKLPSCGELIFYSQSGFRSDLWSAAARYPSVKPVCDLFMTGVLSGTLIILFIFVAFSALHGCL
ncbi:MULTISPECIES: GNAT family N-acetyltransferase [Acutalibacteraceae]|uniref:GNAT family N-acetyltransferase n=1 Tax=Acutalibacteraceae TaxID=3082771 RepID=UPI0013E8ECD8|nr:MULTISPECIES: GNAT family protein [Acutalibacteraceae]